MSLWSVAFLGSTPIGGPIVGFVGGALGARFSLGLGAMAALAAAAFGWTVIRGRNLPQPRGRVSAGPATEVSAVAAGAE
jgi:hypothetical protein